MIEVKIFEKLAISEQLIHFEMELFHQSDFTIPFII